MTRIIVKPLPPRADIRAWLEEHGLCIEVEETDRGWSARFITGDSIETAREVTRTNGYPNTAKNTAEDAVMSYLIASTGALLNIPLLDNPNQRFKHVRVPEFSGFEAFLTELRADIAMADAARRAAHAEDP